MLRDDLSLSGRVAVVTGGSRGIGRAIALALAESGAAVGIAYRDRDTAAQDACTEIEALGRKAFAARCDLSDSSSVTAFFEQVTAALVQVFVRRDDLRLAGGRLRVQVAHCQAGSVENRLR